MRSDYQQRWRRVNWSAHALQRLGTGSGVRYVFISTNALVELINSFCMFHTGK